MRKWCNGKHASESGSEYSRQVSMSLNTDEERSGMKKSGRVDDQGLQVRVQPSAPNKGKKP